MTPAAQILPQATKVESFLWVEDEEPQRLAYVGQLKIKGIDVIAASNYEQAISRLEEHHVHIRCAVIEIGIPLNESETVSREIAQLTRGGERAGWVLGQIIRARYPRIRVIGYSGGSDPEVIDWFQVEGDGYLQKGSEINPGNALKVIEKMLRTNRRERYRPFIVHGHDDEAVADLKAYIEDSLGMPAPIMLKNEQGSVVEKIKDLARLRSLVFVLFTPDDFGHAVGDEDNEAFRARQNVVFQVGYFLGKQDGEQRRLLLLKKGNVEIPSDIAALKWIDISGGILKVDQEIRDQLRFSGIDLGKQPVFISSALEDSIFAKKLYQQLSSDGFRCWDTHDLVAGPKDEQIKRAMRLHPTFILVLSKDSVDSDWVEFQAAKARELEKNLEEKSLQSADSAGHALRRPVLCPIALDKAWETCNWPDWLTHQMRKYVVVDFQGKDFDDAYQKLKKGLELYYPGEA